MSDDDDDGLEKLDIDEGTLCVAWAADEKLDVVTRAPSWEGSKLVEAASIVFVRSNSDLYATCIYVSSKINLATTYDVILFNDDDHFLDPMVFHSMVSTQIPHDRLSPIAHIASGEAINEEIWRSVMHNERSDDFVHGTIDIDDECPETDAFMAMFRYWREAYSIMSVEYSQMRKTRDATRRND